jgi:hypothetical protein
MRPTSARLAPFRLALASLFLLGLSATGRADLAWETYRVELTTRPGDQEAVARFAFKNTSSHPVTITGVHPSCGCTTAELAKRTYAPGEAGSIRASLEVGDRVGTRDVTIEVYTDDTPDAPVVLGLKVTIPEILRYGPRLLLWRKNGEPVEKTVEVIAVDGRRLQAIECLQTPAGVTAQPRVVEAGKKYLLAIRPGPLEKPGEFPLRCLARYDDQTTFPFVVYLLVK